MKVVAAIMREVFGLFVDDGSFAFCIVVVIGLAALTVAFLPHLPLAGGAVLLLGCHATLLFSVVRRAELSGISRGRIHARESEKNN
jgi:hypothetical protein